MGGAMGNVRGADLPAPGRLPGARGFLVGLVLLLGFALPPLLQLKGVPAVRVIRRESGTMKGSAAAGYVAGLASLAALLMWQAGDLVMGSYVIGGFAPPGGNFLCRGWASPRLVTHPEIIFPCGSA